MVTISARVVWSRHSQKASHGNIHLLSALSVFVCARLRDVAHAAMQTSLMSGLFRFKTFCLDLSTKLRTMLDSTCCLKLYQPCRSPERHSPSSQRNWKRTEIIDPNLTSKSLTDVKVLSLRVWFGSTGVH